MKRHPPRRLWTLGLLVVCLLAGTAAAKQSDAVALANRILGMTGVQGGMIVHLGCGDGTLTADLRASDRYLVQGLDTDPARVAADGPTPSSRSHSGCRLRRW
mgnify:CR=1 FL=1